MNYIKGLDTLRAFAVTLVLVWHYIPRHKPYTLAGVLEQFFLPSGVFAVSLFFVLSGYLITNILLKAKQESDNKLQIVKNFIIRRSLRIFPIYYLLLLFLLITSFPFTPGEIPYLFTYTSNFFMFKSLEWSTLAHTWSLSVEEQFYLLWPWLILFVHNRNLKYVFIAFILTGMASSFIIGRIHVLTFDSPARIFTTACFDAFGIGGLYAYLATQKNLGKIVYLLFFMALAVAIYWKLTPYFNMPARLFSFERTVNSFISLGLIHFTINTQAGWLKYYILENRFLNMLGRVSYGMYLYHLPFNYFFWMGTGYLVKYNPSLMMLYNVYISFVLRFAIVLGLSYLSFELIEKRIMRLKLRFAYKKDEHPVNSPLF